MTATVTVPDVKVKPSDKLGPACFDLPGGPRTVVGSASAVLVLAGNPWGLPVLPADAACPRSNGRPLPGAAAVRVADEGGELVGTFDPAAWVEAGGGCDVPRVEVLPGKVECPECDGSGEVTCYACDRDHDCEKCDGSGEVTGPPEEQDVWPAAVHLSVRGREYDLQVFGPLLRLVPPGVATAETEYDRLHLSGPGWRLCVMAVAPGYPVTQDDPAVVPAPFHPEAVP